jgi:hypothetical protein
MNKSLPASLLASRPASLLAFLCLLIASARLIGAEPSPTLEAGFADPPDEAKPWTLWQWMNGNITREGITADLEAFKQAGLGGAQSFHLDYGLPQGPVEFNSDAWRELYLHAAREADRIGIKIGTHNCGGWSSSGGPWNTPENGMQIVAVTEARVRGPGAVNITLPPPAPATLPPGQKNAWRDIAVLAYPVPPNEAVTMSAASPMPTVSEGKGAKPPAAPEDNLFKNFILPPSPDNAGENPKSQISNPKKIPNIPNSQDTAAQKNAAAAGVSFFQIAFPRPFTARQLILTPEKSGFDGVLEVSDDGARFTTVCKIPLASRPERQEYPYRQIFTFPPATGRFFRVTVVKPKVPGKPITIAEAGLSGRQGIENLAGKAFYQRHSLLSWTMKKPPAPPTPPPFGAALADGALALRGIIDITGHLDADGRLAWTAPAGDWTILRVGHQPNGMKNHPAPLGGEGLECDKLSRDAVDAHWAGMMGRLIEKFGPLAGKSFTKVEIDSWEVGTQNWTPKFREEFRARRGYDLLPFLPVFAGQIVENAEVTERFLWDFRRVIADLFAENYAARLRELANRHGMTLAVENYGTGPFDDLQYGGNVDLPMGVMWMHNGSPQGCTLIAASAAHTYGHRVIGCEAFTAGEGGGNRWETDPYALKRLGDLMYCNGVNKFIFHAGVHQPWPHLRPGVLFGKVGTQFGRTLTWWENGGVAWFRYLARCQWLLQQGLPVADVLVLAGENAPPPTYGGSVFPKIPPGHDYDLCSTDALLHRVTAGAGGRLVMPDGMSYRLLLLPDDTRMTPPVLRKLRELAAAGATIIGPPPARSPSLAGYPQCDDEVRRLAVRLWRAADAVSQVSKPASNTGGADARIQKITTQPAAALAALGLALDFEARGHRPQIAHKHRRIPATATGAATTSVAAGAEIYFVSNQKYVADEIEAVFRVTGRTPEIWNPETGAIENAPLWREENGRTVVPLRLDPAGAVFVIFRAPAGPHLVAATLAPDNPAPRQTLEILRANYGCFDRKKRPREADITATKAANYKRIMTPERFVDRDPAPGAPKHMLVQYTDEDGVWHSQAAGEHGVLELPQLPRRFKTTRVLYGDLRADPAATDRTVDVTARLNALVKNGALSVMVRKEELAGNAPLPAKPKELRVEYRYAGRRNIAIIPENQRLELPGAYEATVPAPAFALATRGDADGDGTAAGAIELRAWTPGRYEFTGADGKKFAARVDRVPAPLEITGPWRMTFPPNLGAPPAATFDRLASWTESADPGVKYFSGTATYEKEIEIPAELLAAGIALELDLGAVKNIAQVFLNGRDLGVLWKPPFRAGLAAAARAGKNRLEIKITNLWPNRLVGDEQLPPNREWAASRNVAAWPQWLLDGKPAPAPQVAFATARHYDKTDIPLPSGLLGPVRLVPAVKQTLR